MISTKRREQINLFLHFFLAYTTFALVQFFLWKICWRKQVKPRRCTTISIDLVDNPSTISATIFFVTVLSFPWFFNLTLNFKYYHYSILLEVKLVEMKESSTNSTRAAYTRARSIWLAWFKLLSNRIVATLFYSAALTVQGVWTCEVVCCSIHSERWKEFSK